MNKYFSTFIAAFIFTVIFFTMINFSSCDETPVDPYDKLKPGRRDYIWKMDTLNIGIGETLSFRDIVGNSPDDVWLGNLDPGLWHFDGKSWDKASFPGVAPSALWLFEDNTLIVGTRLGIIFIRENNQWTKSFEIILDGYDIIDIFSMYGITKENIYAVGMATKTIVPAYEYESKGIILHFDGMNWKFVKIPEFNGGGFHKIIYQDDIKTFFIHGAKDWLDILLTFDGSKINEIMSSYAGFGLSKMNGIVYINSQKIIYKYIQNKLVKWKDFTGTDFWSDFVGRSESDFFNNSANGLGHYNGVDYLTILETNWELHTKIIFDKDIFVTAEDYKTRKFIVVHGTLSN